LDSARGKQPKLSELALLKRGYVGKFFLTTLLVAILTVLGFVLLIVPGLIISVAFMMVQFVYIDNAKKPIGVILQTAWDLTKGVRWKLFGFLVVSGLVAVLGVLALGIGLLVATPVIGLAQAALYDALCNRQVVQVAHEDSV
jgi:uncharacterized membrane protein